MAIVSRFGLYLLALSFLQACSEPDSVAPESSDTIVEARTVRVAPGSWIRNFKSYGLVTPAEEYEIGVEISANVPSPSMAP